MKVRPMGVSVLAAAFIILGVYYLLWSIMLFTSGAVLSTSEQLFFEPLGGNKMMGGIMGMITTTVLIITGIGLLGMKTWAWYLSFLAAVLMLVNLVFGLTDGNMLWGIAQLAIVAAVAVYLLSSDVRDTFDIGS